MSELTQSGNSENLYQQVREILSSARDTAWRAVNTAMVSAYWEVGRAIVEEEQRGAERAEYGEYIVRNLSSRLTKEFGKGYTARNLWYMRDFYNTFPNVNAVRSQLTWTHYRLLLRIENPQARAFYEKESVASRWSTRELLFVGDGV